MFLCRRSLLNVLIIEIIELAYLFLNITKCTMDNNVDTNNLGSPSLPPWMSKEEISFVESFINKDSYMLEYGCGGSTLHFPDYVKGYCSIESDEEWFKKIKEHPDNNAAMILIPPKAHEDVIRVAE